MKFSQLAKYKKDTDLVISARYETWMATNSNPVYSPEALEFMQNELAKTPRVRRGTVSASSLGSCKRKQVFGYLGLIQIPPSPKLAGIFQNGTFMHLRWQMAGITEGFVKKAEVRVPENKHYLTGTMDGICYEDSILELKSINTNGFNEVSSFGPKKDHMIQGAAYALTTGREKVVFVYEDKNTQEYKEIVKTRDELPLEEAELSAHLVWDHIEMKELPEPLEGCMAGDSYTFKGCPYRNQCLKIRSWEEAEELAQAS